MKKLSIGIALVSVSVFVNAASFDCSKAKTVQEKLICSDLELNALDKEMGDVYTSTNKSFPIEGYIRNNQRNWLRDYRKCAEPTTEKKDDISKIQFCKEMLNQRISNLKELQTSKVYADYKEKQMIVDSTTLVVLDKKDGKYLQFFGGWMPDANMEPEKMKGYPFDGFICDDEVKLNKVGSIYKTEEYQDVTLQINDHTIVIDGSFSCGLRASIGNDTFNRR